MIILVNLDNNNLSASSIYYRIGPFMLIKREREEKNGRSPLLYNDANINRQIASEASKEGYELNVDEKQGT